MSKVLYTAVVLDENSRDKLLSVINPIHPEVIAHHMTINLGAISPISKHFIGKKVILDVVAHAFDEKVEAIQVEQIGEQPITKNSIPHITVSVDRSKGGKPFLSNKLKEWKPIEKIRIFGTIEEVS